MTTNMNEQSCVSSLILLLSLVIIYLTQSVFGLSSQLLIPNDAAAGQACGDTTKIYNGIIFVGCTFDPDSSTKRGAVYVFNKTTYDYQWTQQQKLTANNANNGDEFGYDISASSDHIIIGAHRTDHRGNIEAGSAYIFTINNNGIYQQQTELIPSISGIIGDTRCGSSVDIYHNIAVIGCFRYNSNTGAAVIFELSNETWTEVQIIYGISTGDQFGYSVSLQYDIIVIGALDGQYIKIYRKSNGNWAETQMINSNEQTFGYTTSIYDNIMTVGAPWSDTVHMYVYNTSYWEETQVLNGSINTRFGSAVELYSDSLIIGAFSDNEWRTSAGAAYLFENDNISWVQTRKLMPQVGIDSSYSGNKDAVSIWNDGLNIMISVGSKYDNLFGIDSGSVTVYYQNNTHSPTTNQPTTTNPTTFQPTTNMPSTSQPTTSNPTTYHPTTDAPTTMNPTTNTPTTNSSTTNNPTTNIPTSNTPTNNPTNDTILSTNSTSLATTNEPTRKPTTFNPTENPISMEVESTLFNDLKNKSLTKEYNFIIIIVVIIIGLIFIVMVIFIIIIYIIWKRKKVQLNTTNIQITKFDKSDHNENTSKLSKINSISSGTKGIHFEENVRMPKDQIEQDVDHIVIESVNRTKGMDILNDDVIIIGDVTRTTSGNEYISNDEFVIDGDSENDDNIKKQTIGEFEIGDNDDDIFTEGH